MRSEKSSKMKPRGIQHEAKMGLLGPLGLSGSPLGALLGPPVVLLALIFESWGPLRASWAPLGSLLGP